MKIIYNNIIPFEGFKAINLFGIMFARKDADAVTERDVNHESIHTAQMRELGYIGFYILYSLEWIVNIFMVGIDWAYRAISFECEAYNHENEPDYLKTRKHYAQWRK